MPAEEAATLMMSSLVPPSDGVPMSRPSRSAAVSSGSDLSETKRMVPVLLIWPTFTRGASRSPVATMVSMSPTRVISAPPAITVWIAWAEPWVVSKRHVQPVVLEVAAGGGDQFRGEGQALQREDVEEGDVLHLALHLAAAAASPPPDASSSFPPPPQAARRVAALAAARTVRQRGRPGGAQGRAGHRALLRADGAAGGKAVGMHGRPGGAADCGRTTAISLRARK